MRGCKYKSDLGHTVMVMHPEGEESLHLIKRMIAHFNPEVMIEFGTAYAGFTTVMYDAAPEALLFTIDKVPGKDIIHRSKGTVSEIDAILWKKFLKNKGVIFMYEDLLDFQRNIRPKALCEFKSTRGKLLYCDNGDKMKEFVYYGSILSPGDIIGVHDWGKEFFPMESPVRELLESEFQMHEINIELKRINSLSRFFIKL